KMIYIDPPYNTGNDFVYNDDYAESSEEYLESSGQYDEQGNRLVQNTESNGRFHTDWLNMIYPRLKVAKDLLSDDGVIFISIDDNELYNMIKTCNEVFGEQNFIAQFNWIKTSTPPSLSKNIRKKFEYVLCYQKKGLLAGLNGGTTEGGDMPLLNEINKYASLKFKKETVLFKIADGTYKSGAYDRVVLENDVTIKDGKATADFVLSGHFKWTQSTVDEEIKQGTTFIIKTEKFAIRYAREGERIKLPSNILSKEECNVGTNEDAQKDILSLFGNKVMDYPKPVSLIKYLSKMVTEDNDIILDFFSGSATTAHAVMQLNAEDGGNRKFIMVQLPEKCDENSEAFKAGYKNICEIGKERIRRAGKKIKEPANLLEDPKNVDVGFRVLKLDSSNMKDVYYKPSDYTQNLLDSLESNIKEDRTPLDLLFQVMLDLGKPLSAKIEEKEIAGKHVYIVNEDDLIACFDDGITEDVVKEIAKKKPLFAVFRDSGLSSDSTSTNFDQIFATYSPNTTRRVL
ncbi:MAG: site-specific DNA-methyltransferase, partial [Clostridia bacterium]|nr:site-specific DNA-methyltransferase [Clostridia bacterium]